jgi:tetratricopeptide (TPR) repeat protein
MTRRWTWAALGLLLVATTVAYLPALDGAFVIDDVSIISDPLVAAPGRANAVAWLRSARPVLTATYALDHARFGLETRGWHATNLLVHLAAILLAWRLARRLLARAGLERPEGAALAAAALFALHPLQTEAVAYVTQRAESLASACFLAGLLLLLARDEGGARRGWLLAGAVAIQAAGLLVKPIVATLPAAWLLAAAVLPTADETGRPPWRRIVGRLPAALPLFALSAASAAWGLYQAAGSNHAGFDMPDLPAGRYFATQLRVVPTYLRLLAWPAGQCADWYFTVSDGLLDRGSLAGGLFLGALLGGALWLSTRHARLGGDGPAVARLAGFGIPFFLLVLAPSSSFVPLRDPLAEHRVYLASLGLFVVVATAVSVALRRAAPARAARAGAAIAVVALVALGAATARRSVVWSGTLALYQDAAEKAPEKARVHLSLGQALAMAERYEEALAHFRRARSLATDRTLAPGAALQNVVFALLMLDRLDEARGEVQGALRQDPRDAALLALLADVEYSALRDAEAEAAAVAALAIEPFNVMALKYLGMARARAGDLAGAADALRAAEANDPLEPQVLQQLGRVEERLGNRDAACRAYGRAAELPRSPMISRTALASHRRLGCR